MHHERPATIDGFLASLRARLPWTDRWWRGALAEVEDHLRCGAEAGSEAEAVARFGSVEAVFAGLAREYASLLSARLSGMLGFAVVGIVVWSGLTRNGPFLTGHLPSPWLSLGDFLLSQLGYSFAALAILVARSHPGAALRAAWIAIGSFGYAVLAKLVWTLTLSAADPLLQQGLLVVAAMVPPAVWSLVRRGRRLGALNPYLDAAAAPRWVTLLRRRPLLVASAVCTAAGAAAFRLGAMRDGVWPAFSAASGWGPVVAGAVCAATEVCAVVAGCVAALRLLAAEERPGAA